MTFPDQNSAQAAFPFALFFAAMLVASARKGKI